MSKIINETRTYTQMSRKSNSKNSTSDNKDHDSNDNKGSQSC